MLRIYSQFCEQRKKNLSFKYLIHNNEKKSPWIARYFRVITPTYG